MPYKTDEDGGIVIDDGKPVFIKDDGTETAVDFEVLIQEVNSTRSESKARKEKLRAIEKDLAKYSDFKETDPETIKKALDIMTNLDQKELVKAGERDEAIRQAVENTEQKFQPMLTGYEQKFKELTSDLEQKKRLIENQVVSQSLSNSAFLDKMTNTSPDVRQTVFGGSFKVEEVNGNLQAVAYKQDGEKLYSPNNPAQLCSTEEALQILWNQYPYKELYSKQSNSGSGSVGNAGGTGQVVYSKLEWMQKLQSANQQEKAALARSVMDGKTKIK